jgi:hypothetical protein
MLLRTSAPAPKMHGRDTHRIGNLHASHDYVQVNVCNNAPPAEASDRPIQDRSASAHVAMAVEHASQEAVSGTKTAPQKQ